MRSVHSLVPLLAALAVAAATPLLVAQEEPLTAGSEGVPAPKRTRHVQPVYPQEALAQGIRGIVILEIVLDDKGKVESTTIIRSVPGLDEAAIAAARQWEYAPTKVDGKPVRVRVTVPVVFSLALPTISRQAGIPELRQGVSPAWPTGTSGGGLARAEVTLETDGRVGSARILEGNPPWSDALLAALKTWRFAPPPEDEVLTFRVEAEFLPEGGAKGERRVSLEATGLQRSGLLEGPQTPEAAAPAPPSAVAQAPPPATTPAEPRPTSPERASPAGESAPETPVPSPQQPKPTPAETAPGGEQPAPTTEKSTPAQPAPAQPVPTQPVPTQPVPTQPSPPQPPPGTPPSAPGTPGQPAPSPQAQPATPPADATTPPPVEVITAPPPAPPPENGVSAIRDVTLEPGVPDLTRGRRPVAPPFARMSGTTGTVEVAFSVGTSGTTTVQSASGPDLLRPAAEQAVASWVFRRTRADRAYLVAVFTYTGDKSSAVVRPQGAPADAAPAGNAAPPAGAETPTGNAAPPSGAPLPQRDATESPAAVTPDPDHS